MLLISSYILQMQNVLMVQKFLMQNLFFTCDFWVKYDPEIS